MPLEIQHVSLAQLLLRPEAFQMARYQRHYEWGRKEMEQLLDDLDEAFAAHQADPAAGVYHFLGNVILFANPAGHLEVVDGQQRLTSLTLLLAAARDLAADKPLRETLRTLTYAAAQQPRMRLHRGDDAFLTAHILAGTTTGALDALGKQDMGGAECLRTNAMIARAGIAGRAPAELVAFICFVLDAGRFVEIMVGSEDDAFRIFETVNNRGRAISSEDVLRYALVEYATPDAAKRDDLLTRWDAMEAELGPRGMRRFVSGWRVRVTKGARPRQPLHRIVLDSFRSPVEALAFLESELSSDLSTFRQIETGDIALAEGPHKRRIDTLLRSLGLLDFDEWLPVVTELIGRGLTQPARLAADLARVERLAWYYYLNRDDKGVYQDRRDEFSALMKTVAKTGTLASVPAKSLLTAVKCAKMRDILQERLDPKWIPLRSLLVRLEMALAGDGTGVVRNDVTIEHILPLRPNTKGWLSLYDNSIKVVTDHAERIGNLCLVSSDLNTQLGNRIYASKRKLMLEYGVPAQTHLAADLARETNWTREVIQRRSKWLLKVFCDTFDVHAGTR